MYVAATSRPQWDGALVICIHPLVPNSQEFVVNLSRSEDSETHCISIRVTFEGHIRNIRCTRHRYWLSGLKVHPSASLYVCTDLRLRCNVGCAKLLPTSSLHLAFLRSPVSNSWCYSAKSYLAKAVRSMH